MMHVHIDELTPEEVALHGKRKLLRLDLRGREKAANGGVVRCAYCQSEMSQSQTHLSHLIPLGQGGQTDVHNVVLACSACCESKNARTLPDWAELLSKQLDGVHALITKQTQKAEKPAA